MDKGASRAKLNTSLQFARLLWQSGVPPSPPPSAPAHSSHHQTGCCSERPGEAERSRQAAALASSNRPSLVKPHTLLAPFHRALRFAAPSEDDAAKSVRSCALSSARPAQVLALAPRFCTQTQGLLWPRTANGSRLRSAPAPCCLRRPLRPPRRPDAKSAPNRRLLGFT